MSKPKPPRKPKENAFSRLVNLADDVAIAVNSSMWDLTESVKGLAKIGQTRSTNVRRGPKPATDKAGQRIGSNVSSRGNAKVAGKVSPQQTAGKTGRAISRPSQPASGRQEGARAAQPRLGRVEGSASGQLTGAVQRKIAKSEAPARAQMVSPPHKSQIGNRQVARQADPEKVRSQEGASRNGSSAVERPRTSKETSRGGRDLNASAAGKTFASQVPEEGGEPRGYVTKSRALAPDETSNSGSTCAVREMLSPEQLVMLALVFPAYSKRALKIMIKALKSGRPIRGEGVPDEEFIIDSMIAYERDAAVHEALRKYGCINDV